MFNRGADEMTQGPLGKVKSEGLMGSSLECRDDDGDDCASALSESCACVDGASEMIESIEAIMLGVAAFRHTLSEESDQGCALLATAYLHGKLKELLRNTLVDDPSSLNPKLDRMSLASVIDWAYWMGLLSPKEREDLTRIRKIRNVFAHEMKKRHFADVEISRECYALYHAANGARSLKRPRQCFTGACMSISALIDIRIREAVHAESPENVDYGKKGPYKKCAAAAFSVMIYSMLSERASAEGNDLDSFRYSKCSSIIEAIMKECGWLELEDGDSSAASGRAEKRDFDEVVAELLSCR